MGIQDTELSDGCDAMVEEGNELFDGQRARKQCGYRSTNIF